MTPISQLSSIDDEIPLETPPSFIPPTPSAPSDPLTAAPAPLQTMQRGEGVMLTPQATLTMLASLIQDWLPVSGLDAATQRHLASVLEEERSLLSDVLQRCEEQREQDNAQVLAQPNGLEGMHDSTG
ncbi:hypothetical protein [Klebsiella pneumoniae]|uniref:hypothetical protein n=1 Tax=Klebsiella pneumoniae TaxID=573 RepID=UPI0012614174|nr:hypothetical protein [Klebsiella pneumoniae]KAB7536410.1 hypothetical protein GBV82_06490 [Klebsiella pneumoniae]